VLGVSVEIEIELNLDYTRLKKDKYISPIQIVHLTSLFPIGTYVTMATSRVETNRHISDDG